MAFGQEIKVKKLIDKTLNCSTLRKRNKGLYMFLPFYKLFVALFVYHLTLEGLKKVGIIKSK